MQLESMPGAGENPCLGGDPRAERTFSAAMDYLESRADIDGKRIACMGGPLPESMSSAFASCLPAMVGESSLNAVEVKLIRHQAAVQDAFVRLTAG